MTFLRRLFLPRARVAPVPRPVHPLTKVLGLGVTADVLSSKETSNLDKVAYVAVPLIVEQVVNAGARRGARECAVRRDVQTVMDLNGNRYTITGPEERS